MSSVPVQRSDAMYGVLLAGERVVALAQPRAHALHAHDLLLLASFVLGSGSFRAAAESFSPICLPHFNPTAFLHAYVRFLDEVRLRLCAKISELAFAPLALQRMCPCPPFRCKEEEQMHLPWMQKQVR